LAESIAVYFYYFRGLMFRRANSRLTSSFSEHAIAAHDGGFTVVYSTRSRRLAGAIA